MNINELSRQRVLSKAAPGNGCRLYAHGAAPVIILSISYFLFKEKIGWQALVGTVLAIAGGSHFISCLIGGDPMNHPIFSPRLQLLPLNRQQLEMILQDPEAFEKSLKITLMRTMITDRVRRALRMKIAKMKQANASQHVWLTYWLILLPDENVGAGLVGFKGFPDENGSTEIGYGIDPAYQGKGYMGEAVQALIDWAFTHPFCKVVTASEVENPSSRRLLERLGAQRVHECERSTSWEMRKVPD